MKNKMAFNPEFFITGLSELAPSTIAVFKAFAGPQKDKYGFLVYVSFRRLLWIILEFLLIKKKRKLKNENKKINYPIVTWIFFWNADFISEFDDIIVKWFKEMLISRNLLKIELPWVYFWTLSFFKFLAA